MALFFGYGSLVNRASHQDNLDMQPARLHGWRRVWRRSPIREVAFLSVEPCAGVAIDGLLARVPGGDWAALDAREAAYRKCDITHQLSPRPDGPVMVYELPRDQSNAPTDAHPILLSYVDVVASGFLDLYGPAGVAHFFDTTAGWLGPIRDDRACPIYPRAGAATDAGRDAVDVYLAQLGVRMIRV